MARVLVDTTVLIDALRGRPAVERLRRLHVDGDDACICPINVEEIMRGTLPREVDDTRRFLSGFFLVPLGPEEGDRAGTWRREHARRGVTLSQADCLVAAAALRARARLVTGNPDHFPMAEVEVEHWPVGT